MSVRISKYSRLQFTDLIEKDGHVFWDPTPQVSIPPQIDDISYTIVDFDRIDRLAFKFYGDPALWWVIAQANDWELVPTDMHVGDIVRIPSPRYVQSYLFGKNNR